MFSNCRGGFRQDLSHYVRSEWEANVCRSLKSKNIQYQYEFDTFPVNLDDKIHYYTPDFKLLNKYIEVKGHAKSSVDWGCCCKICDKSRRVYEAFKKSISSSCN